MVYAYGMEMRTVHFFLLFTFNVFYLLVLAHCYSAPTLADSCANPEDISTCSAIKNPTLCVSPGGTFNFTGASQKYGCRWSQKGCEVNDPCTGDVNNCSFPCFWNRFFARLFTDYLFSLCFHFPKRYLRYFRFDWSM
jgi:hypothetical protein